MWSGNREAQRQADEAYAKLRKKKRKKPAKTKQRRPNAKERAAGGWIQSDGSIKPFLSPAEAKKHKANKAAAASQLAEVRKWCDSHDVNLIVKNFNHHWQFTYYEKLADWWPSSSKLVLDTKYDRPIRVRTWLGLKSILEERWRPKGGG